MDDAISNERKAIHEILQSSLKQEIGAMREMLTSMQQEELTLLAKDRKAWTQVMLERVGLLTRLCELRSTRIEVTHRLESINGSAPNLIKEEDCEILSMRDQLTALIEKMNQQNIRIHTIEAGDIKSMSSSHVPLPTPSKEAARTILATYPRPK